MINLFNFAAVPFNSPIYERMERGREELRMEVMRELQDRESHISRLLFTPEDYNRDSPAAARRQSHISSRLPFGAKQNEPALTCLVVPGARTSNDENVRGCNGDSDGQTEMSRQPTTRERGRLDGDLDEQNSCQPTREERGRLVGSIKVPVAASLICLLLLFSIAKR